MFVVLNFRELKRSKILFVDSLRYVKAKRLSTFIQLRAPFLVRKNQNEIKSIFIKAASRCLSSNQPSSSGSGHKPESERKYIEEFDYDDYEEPKTAGQKVIHGWNFLLN